MRTIATAAVMISVCYATPAAAWWDFAKWGMTEQQIAAASKGRAQLCTQSYGGVCGHLKTGRGQVVAEPRIYIPSITIAGEPAAVSFAFDGAGTLKMTIVEFERARYRAITDTLSGIYGPPFHQYAGAFANMSWRDPKKGTLITALEAGRTRVTYEPIRSGL